MSLQEKCGVFAINNIANASFYCALGLHSLQHRGQEGAGIVARQNSEISASYLSEQINNNFDIFKSLKGNSAIGHVRYSTSGKKGTNSLQQPISANLALGKISLAHNGNLIDIDNLRKKLIELGCIFQSDIDTEILVHLIAISKKTNFTDRIIEALLQIKGAYSLIVMTPDTIIGIRDPMGIRPLVLGKVNGSHIISSESCAFDVMNATFIRDIRPGEMLIIDNDNNIKSIYPFKRQNQKSCIFEYIYFARPDSVMDDLSVYKVRKEIGREMAKEDQKRQRYYADLVLPVPDSGLAAALGYSQESKIQLEFGIIRNHYIGRTFIQPTKDLRNFNVKLKHSTNTQILKGKKVILIDDSIVRGTTARKIVELVREAGAKEIHMRISSPPITHPCFYGIDTPEKDKLIAHNNSIEEIAKLIRVDSLQFISIEGLYKAVKNKKNYCDACFTGNYLM